MAAVPLWRKLNTLFSFLFFRRGINWCACNMIVKALTPLGNEQKIWHQTHYKRQCRHLCLIVVFRVLGGAGCFWFSPRPRAFHEEKSLLAPFGFWLWMDWVWYPEMLFSHPTFFFIFFLSLYTSCSSSKRRASQLEFCQYEERILLQAAGLYHLGVLGFRCWLSAFAL